MALLVPVLVDALADHPLDPLLMVVQVDLHNQDQLLLVDLYNKDKLVDLHNKDQMLVDLHKEQLLVVLLNQLQHNNLPHPSRPTKPQPLHPNTLHTELLHHSIKIKQQPQHNIKLSMQLLQPVLHNHLLLPHSRLLVWIQPKLPNNSNNTCSITSKPWHIGNSIKRLEGNLVQQELHLRRSKGFNWLRIVTFCQMANLR